MKFNFMRYSFSSIKEYREFNKWAKEERKKYEKVRLSKLSYDTPFYWVNPVDGGAFGGNFVEVTNNGVRIIYRGDDGRRFIDRIIDDRDVWVEIGDVPQLTE